MAVVVTADRRLRIADLMDVPHPLTAVVVRMRVRCPQMAADTHARLLHLMVVAWVAGRRLTVAAGPTVEADRQVGLVAADTPPAASVVGATLRAAVGTPPAAGATVAEAEEVTAVVAGEATEAIANLRFLT